MSKITWRFGSYLSVTALLSVAGCGGAPSPPEAGPAETSEEASEQPSTCPAPASWFPHSQTARPSFEAPFQTNCDFHKWSFQELLYVTETADGDLLRFETMASPHSLFGHADPAPWPPPSPSLPRHCDGRELSGGGRVLLLRAGKLREDFASTGQAGTQDVLIDQMGQVVYYEARVNETYYNFIKDNGLSTKEGLDGASADQDFPVGAVELKTSWRVVATGGETFIEDAASRFYTIDAYIQPPGKTPACVEDATLALVGFHVVGRVEGHPEFIWATFEQRDNAPNCDETPVSGPGPLAAWSFYSSGTDCKVSGTCNVGTRDVTSTPSEVCRVHASGGGDSENLGNIRALNESVHEQMADDSVWQNYELVGAVWTNNGQLPPTNLKGSTDLANTSLESFAFAATGSCFSCHSTHAPGKCLSGEKHLYLSHLVALACPK